jgi:hypothetical protein
VISGSWHGQGRSPDARNGSIEETTVEHVELGTRERALLLALMALGGEASNPQLQDAVNDTLAGRSRLLLNERGLVVSRKVGRAFAHELTEAGWDWCLAELTAPPPPRAGALGRTLYCLLPVISAYLDHADISLAELIVPPVAGAAEEGPTVATDLEGQVRRAYWKLARRPQDWVLLTAVRPLLGDAPHEEVDAVLQRMERLPDVFIAPEANQKMLTKADWEAAVRIGGTPKHLLSIEAP